jgi:hypothetical protein
MKLNAGQKKLLKLYRKLRGTNPTGIQIVLMNLPSTLVITVGGVLGAGILVALAGSWPDVLHSITVPGWFFITVPGWFFFAAVWVGSCVPIVLMTYFYANQWAVIEQVTDWDRVGELLSDDE